MIRTLLIALMALWMLFSGCSSKDLQVNQPAEHWYNQMIRQIAMGNLDMAGDHFTSLSGEHPRSALIREATMMMAFAHMDRDEYLLANFYLDEYIRRFGSAQDVDRARFFKLVADYRGIARAGRDQRLILDSLDRAEVYTQQHGDSVLAAYAASLHTQLLLGRGHMDAQIADLYDRLKKPDAAAFYEERSRIDLVDRGEVQPPKPGFIRGLFE